MGSRDVRWRLRGFGVKRQSAGVAGRIPRLIFNLKSATLHAQRTHVRTRVMKLWRAEHHPLRSGTRPPWAQALDAARTNITQSEYNCKRTDDPPSNLLNALDGWSVTSVPGRANQSASGGRMPANNPWSIPRIHGPATRSARRDHGSPKQQRPRLRGQHVTSAARVPPHRRPQAAHTVRGHRQSQGIWRPAVRSLSNLLPAGLDSAVSASRPGSTCP